MKRTVAVLLSILLLSCFLPTVIASSASSDFTVEGGVLVSYSGGDTSVSIPDTVYSIASSAFMGNTDITSVTIPSSVVSIGDRAFYGCSSLSSVSGGTNVSYIGAAVFEGTPYLTDSTTKYITLGNTVVWYNGTSTSVTLADKYVCVAPYAFAYSALKSFSGPSLRTVGEGAFYGCDALTSVTLPSSLSYVGAYAFFGTPYLDSLGDFAVVGDGIMVAYQGDDTTVSVPASVRQIAPRAFAENTTVTAVTLPSATFSVGSQAFLNCTALRELNLSNGLVSIGREAFACCTALSQLITPDSLSNIGVGAFLSCTGLGSVSLSGNSLTIGNAAFSGCTALEVAMFSNTVFIIGASAFDGDENLRAISVCPSVGMIASNAFLGCQPLTAVVDEGSYAQSSLYGTATLRTARGDADEDGTVSIFDVTRIQRYVAEMSSLTPIQLALADTDMDALVSILDATRIQRQLAQLG